MKYKAIEEIDAMQWDGREFLELNDFVEGKLIVHNGAICIGTPKEILKISAKDYVIKDSEGEILVVKPDIFEKKYEKCTKSNTVQAVDGTILVIEGIINDVLKVINSKKNYIYKHRYDCDQYGDFMELETLVMLIGDKYINKLK